MSNNELAKIKKIELEVLDYFVNICQKNNLTYFLYGGTLLGAVRHAGFIPWDDDIDVSMPPEDYIKFLNIMEKEKNNKYYIQNIYNTESCTYTFTKIRKYHTTMVEKDLNYLPFKKGINIDVFPLIRYPNGKIGKKVFMYRFRLAELLVTREYKGKTLKGKIIHFLLHLFPKKFINKKAISKMNKLIKYNGDFDEYRVAFFKGLDKKWFRKSSLLFEKKEYCVPEGYDAMLTEIYGDYMTPPSEDKRLGHGNGNLIISFTKDYDE